MSKTRTFNVPFDAMLDFALIMEESGLQNSIMGSEEDCITVEVEYEPEDRDTIFEIMELIDEEI